MLNKFCHIYLLVFILAVIGINFVDAGAYTSVQANKMMAGPSWIAPFGFDALGRNLFLRTLFSAQVSLFLGLVSATVTAPTASPTSVCPGGSSTLSISPALS